MEILEKAQTWKLLQESDIAKLKHYGFEEFVAIINARIDSKTGLPLVFAALVELNDALERNDQNPFIASANVQIALICIQRTNALDTHWSKHLAGKADYDMLEDLAQLFAKGLVELAYCLNHLHNPANPPPDKQHEKIAISTAQARELTRLVELECLGIFERTGLKVEPGQPLIDDFAEMHRIRQVIYEGLWKAVRETYRVSGPESLTYRDQLLLFEYRLAQEGINQFIRTIASSTWVMTTVVVLAWCLAFLASPNLTPLVPVALEITLIGLATLWIWVLSLDRAIIEKKGNRLREIEDALGWLSQHKRFSYAVRKTLLELHTPGGHTSAIITYWILAFASVLFAALWNWQWWLVHASWGLVVFFVLPMLFVTWWGSRCKVKVIRYVEGYEPRGLVHGWWLTFGGYREPREKRSDSEAGT